MGEQTYLNRKNSVGLATVVFKFSLLAFLRKTYTKNCFSYAIIYGQKTTVITRPGLRFRSFACFVCVRYQGATNREIRLGNSPKVKPIKRGLFHFYATQQFISAFQNIHKHIGIFSKALC